MTSQRSISKSREEKMKENGISSLDYRYLFNA